MVKAEGCGLNAMVYTLLQTIMVICVNTVKNVLDSLL